MGKRITSQRRGHGSSTYRSPSHRHLAPPEYPKGYSGYGIVTEIRHSPGKSWVGAEVTLETGKRIFIIAAEGMYIGQRLAINTGGEVSVGDIMPLGTIPEGTIVFNIEGRPGCGGKFIRSGGGYGVVVSRGEKTVVQMPSGKFKSFPSGCLATVGKVAGGGRGEKPFLTAGKRYHSLRSKAKKWPRVRGIAMNPVNHPHGGGSHQHVGRPSTVSANAPPGRKVGRLSRKKKKKR